MPKALHTVKDAAAAVTDTADRTAQGSSLKGQKDVQADGGSGDLAGPVPPHRGVLSKRTLTLGHRTEYLDLDGGFIHVWSMHGTGRRCQFQKLTWVPSTQPATGKMLRKCGTSISTLAWTPVSPLLTS